MTINQKQPMIYGFKFGEEIRKLFHRARMQFYKNEELNDGFLYELLDLNMLIHKIDKKTILHKVIRNTIYYYYVYEREDIRDHWILNTDFEDTIDYFNALYQELSEYTICDDSYINRIENKFIELEKLENSKKFDEFILEEYDQFVKKIESIIDQIIDEVFSILFSNIHFLFDFNFVISKIAEEMNFEKAKRQYIPIWLKTAIIFRDKGRCQYCGKDLSNTFSLTQPRDVQLDHIIPLESYGNNDPTNFQLTCAQCNKKKSANIVEPKGFNIPWW